MSNTPGISPITTDVEDIRHSDEDGFFGDESEHVTDADEADDGEPETIDKAHHPSR